MPEAYRAWAQEYGPLFRVYFGSTPAVVVSDAASIKAVQLSHYTRPSLMSPIDLSLSRQAAAFYKANMLVTRDRSFHRDVKSAFLPIFRAAYLDSYAPLMLDGADRLADRLVACARAGAEVDVWRLLGAMTLQVVLACGFGVDTDALATAGAADSHGKPVAAAAGPMAPTIPVRAAGALGGGGSAGSSTDDSEGAGDGGTPEDAAALLDAARTLFQTPGRASPYFLIAQALPRAFRPLVRLAATAFPDPALRAVNAARALTQGTVLGLVQDTRAAAELRRAACCTGRGGSREPSRGASPAPAAASPSPTPPATPSLDGGEGVGGREDGGPAGAVAGPVEAHPQHPLVRMRRASDDATRLEAEAEAAAKAAAQAQRSPTAAAAAARRKLAALPGSFLTHMTTARKADGSLFTDVEVGQAANTFLLAGYETTATALAMTLYYCAATPGAWGRLVEEVGAVLEGRDPAPSDLAELPFLSACFSEALRLSPPGSATIREATRDITLHGFKITKGTAIHNAVFSAQRDRAVWGEDADEFVPDRWLRPPSGPAGAPPPELLAFGGGALMCVGQRFALEEAKMTLVRLAARGLSFDLSPGQVPLAMHAPLTYGPAKGVFMTPRLDEARAAADAVAWGGVGGGTGKAADAGCTGA